MDAISRLTVLYDAECALCRWVRSWLEASPTLVPLEFVPLGSAEARLRFPGLDHERTREEVTVVADTGEVWTAEAAWVPCLWATAEHRGLAELLARPDWRGTPRQSPSLSPGGRRDGGPPSPATTVPDVTDEAAGPATARGEETRTRILEAALRLFEERGYEKTTMRVIAATADVSLGNAYYYFASKEHLVQGFYDRMQVLHAAETARRIEGVEALADRLRLAEEAYVEVARPYHPFAGRFFAVAARPWSPLNPFSRESAGARRTSTRIYADLVTGADVRGDPRVLAELPELLWLAHMGLVLYWVHDDSEGQERTLLLARRAAPLVERLVRASRWRPLRPLAHEVLDLGRDLRGEQRP